MPSITAKRHDALTQIEAMCGAQGAQLVAMIHKDHTFIAQQAEDIRTLEQRIDELEAQLKDVAAQNCDARIIKTRGELMTRAKALSAAGIPCVMRGDYIIHAHTRAVLAQVAQ